MLEKRSLDKQKIANIDHLEKRDWELWTMAILMILVLTLYVLISHIWEMSDSPREWSRELMSVKTYLTGSTFLILLFCLYVSAKNLELRRLRKQLFIQKAELDEVASTLEEVTAFYQISSVIITKQNLATILESIVRESLHCLKANRSTIYSMDEGNGVLKMKISHASNPLDERVNLSDEKEIARKAIMQNRPYLLGQPEDFVNFFNYAAQEKKINSLMSIPILLNDKPAAVLSVVRINGESRFNKENMKVLSVFSNYASIAIENSNLMEEVRRKISYRKKYEKYYTNILDLLQDISEEERGEVEEHVKSLLCKQKNQAKERITLIGELNAERRQDERLEEILQVEFEDSPIGQTVNISRGGAFIRTPNPLDLEEEFLLKLHIPDGQEPMEALCKVVWTNKYGKESEELPRGMGVKFLGLQDELKRRIEEFIKIQKSRKLLQENETTPLP